MSREAATKAAMAQAMKTGRRHAVLLSGREFTVRAWDVSLARRGTHRDGKRWDVVLIAQ